MNFHQKIILPFSDHFTGWDVSKSLKFLLSSQYWSKSQIEEYQIKSLKRIIKHAYENVSYYNKKFKEYGITPSDIKDLSDIKKIPILTKDIIIENFANKKILAQGLTPNSYRYAQSSGSTGKRTRYYISKNAYGFDLAANIRGWYWMGYCLGDKFIKVTQNKRKNIIKIIQDYLNRNHLFTLQYKEENYFEFEKVLKNYKPKYLRSYPDPLLFLSKYFRENNIDIYGINAINTTGNILFPEARDIIERVFHAKIFDSYNCEGGPNVFECPSHEQYHVSDEYGILEILDENQKDVKPGKIGRLISTDFFNFAAPFIRYESLDLAERGKTCICGRSLSTIKKIIGRENDILISPSGQFLIGQTFTTYFKNISEIDNFQILQPHLNNLIIRIVINAELSEKKLDEIVSYWSTYTNHEMLIKIEVVNDLPLLQSGKRKFLDRDSSIKLYL